MPAVMRWMKDRLAALVARGENGAAAVEYGLLVALIAVAIIAAVILVGKQLNTTYTCVGNSLPTSAAATPTPAC